MPTYNGFKSIEAKEFYERTLLKTAMESNILLQFGKKSTLPKNHGDVMTWRKRKPVPVQLDTNGKVRTLTEGITPASNKLEFVEYRSTINEYGDWIKLTKKLTNLAIDPILTEAMEGLGESAGDTFDLATAQELYKATNIEYAGGKAKASVTASDTIKVADLHRIKAHMRRRNVKPYENGKFIMLITPEVEFDLKNDTTVNASWVDINKYTAGETVAKGEIGSFMGFKFVVYNKLQYGKIGASDAVTSHKCIVLGKDAFGYVDLEGESAARPQVYYNAPGTVGTDPLKQRHSVAWKNEGWGVKILDASALAIFEVPSSLAVISDLEDNANPNYVTTISGTAGQYQSYDVQDSSVSTPANGKTPVITD